MPVLDLPLSITIPAATAAAAYLNAKGSVWYDLLLTRSALRSAFSMMYTERTNRLNLFYTLEDKAKDSQLCNKDMLIFEGKHYTYAAVYDAVLRYGNWIRTNLGVKPKDVVAMDFQNSETFIFIWWALWSIGAKPAFINYNLTDQPLAHTLKTSTAKICLVDPNVVDSFTDDVRGLISGMKVVAFTKDLEVAAMAMEPVRAPDSDRSEDLAANMAILIYTSGTTGLPKPAIVSWGKLIVGGGFPARFNGYSINDVMYTSMPLYHSAASMMGVCSTVIVGSTLALGRKFSTKLFWNEVRASNATIIQYVGETLRYLLAASPQLDPVTGESLDKKHNVRVALGNGLRPDVWNKFKERFGVETICEFYGATEGTFASWNLSSNDFSLGAIGRSGWLIKALMGKNIAIVEMDWETEQPWRDPKTGFCKKTEVGKPGEMISMLPAENLEERFQGYFNNPKASAAKVMRNVFAKGDAWFRTGDVIQKSPEGLTYFMDRIGDTFRWKSENVSTAEVSQAIGMHPAVREANVYGVELPNHDGRAGCVTICFDKANAEPDVLRSLVSHLRKTLPSFAVPLFLRVVPEMATDTTGTLKQQKHNLRKAGVSPDLKDGAELYWLRGDTYLPFGKKDWSEIVGGGLKL